MKQNSKTIKIANSASTKSILATAHFCKKGFFLTTAEFTEIGVFLDQEVFTLRPRCLRGEFFAPGGSLPSYPLLG
jgi:hypothetical protein